MEKKKKYKLILTAKFATDRIDLEPTTDYPDNIETKSGKESAENLIKSFSIMMGTYKTDEAEASFLVSLTWSTG